MAEFLQESAVKVTLFFLNSLTLEIHCIGVTLVMAKSKIKLFLAKLEIFKQYLCPRKLSNFQNVRKDISNPGTRMIIYFTLFKRV